MDRGQRQTLGLPSLLRPFPPSMTPAPYPVDTNCPHPVVQSPVSLAQSFSLVGPFLSPAPTPPQPPPESTVSFDTA